MMSISEINNLLIETQNNCKYIEIPVSEVGKFFPDMIRDIWHEGSVNKWRYFINTHNGKLKVKKKKKK